MGNLIGQSLGRYHILEQLGEGGMATVYKAFDTRLERDVAVKVIRVEQFGTAVMERMLKRFEREAKALAKLSHPNIVKIHDFGEHEGVPYLVMEYLPGGTLKERLGKSMPWQEATRLLLPIARALDYAHKQAMIHRDVKPSNILVTHSGDPMLTDFGIAKILEGEDSQTLTATGVGVGTPEYMAPEQWTGDTLPASDIYALGVVLYELITGRKPYTADTPAAVLIKQVSEPLPRPAQFIPSLPEGVEKLLLKALAKDPKDRYPDMTALVGAMEGLLAGTASQPSPHEPVVHETTIFIQTGDSHATIDQGLEEDTEKSNHQVDAEATIEQEVEEEQVEPIPAPDLAHAHPRPRWIAVLWFALIWGGCYALGLWFGMLSRLSYGFIIVFSIAGALGGFLTALVLRGDKVICKWKTVLWISAAWAICWALVEWIGVSIGWWAAYTLSGALGAALTLVFLRRENPLYTVKRTHWIIYGWALGWALSQGIGQGIIFLYPFLWNVLAVGIIGAIAGAIGGAFMIWHLRKITQMDFPMQV